MARKKRIILPNYPHHITQRGNNRQNVFLQDDDFYMYMYILKNEAEEYEFNILGYCLMPNHVHIIGIPKNGDSISNTVEQTHSKYAKYINRFYNRCGHLWHSRFYSCPMDRSYFFAAMVYVELNPIRAKLVKQPFDYTWSSASAHFFNVQKDPLLDMELWHKFLKGVSWEQYMIREYYKKENYRKIKYYTQIGLPIGNYSFLTRLETKLKLQVRPYIKNSTVINNQQNNRTHL